MKKFIKKLLGRDKKIKSRLNYVKESTKEETEKDKNQRG